MFKKFHGIGLLLLLMAWGLPPASAQPTPVPIGELTDSMRRHPKPALILISTDWCSYCRMQQAQLKKSRAWQHARSAVYFSEFDAETKQPIVFNNTTYRFTPTGVATGSHELAFALGNIDNRLAFPTWVLLNEHFEIVFKFPGVLKANELKKLLESIGQPAPPE